MPWGLPENQSKPGVATTTIKNADGEVIAWDMIEEACNVPSNRKQDTSFLTVAEASRRFKLTSQAICSRAKRNGWRMINHRDKQKLLAEQKKGDKRDWGKSGESHREQAFKIANTSLKKFRARAPKDFKELDIADRIARRAAGLENDSVVQQTLVHINEAVEGHAEAQIIEAYEVRPEAPQIEDAS
jgi:hypothetical protein